MGATRQDSGRRDSAPADGGPTEPDQRDSGRKTTARKTSGLADHFRQIADEHLVALLRARPDLATPVPPDLAVLASRAQSRLSVARTLEQLNRFEVEVLDAIRLVDGPPTEKNLIARLEYGAQRTAVLDALAKLKTLALTWEIDGVLRLPGAVAEVLGPYPAGLGRPIAELEAPTTVELAAATLADAPEAAREIAAKLAAGPPVGRVRGARRVVDDPDSSPVRWLLSRGLLVAVDNETVELPREIALLIRGDKPLGELHPTAPEPSVRKLDTDTADAAGGGQAQESIRLVEAIGEATAAAGPGQLRAGGMGVRELRRLAKDVGVDETTAAMLLEICFAAGLLDSETDTDPRWLPTPEFDLWRERAPSVRWQRLADTWLTMQRLPSLVGQRDDRDKLVNVLSSEVMRTSAPLTRRDVLAAVAELPKGAAPTGTGVEELVNWHRPRRAGQGRAEAIAAVLAEAASLGITGRGALTSYGRELLAGDSNAAADQLTDLLPAPLDHFLVQPDLTVVAPGPLRADVAAEITSVATVESAGAATVYRVDESSVRRALDGGWAAADLHDLFASRSSTPIPQALTYLIDDTARRHGGLRAGSAGSYLRSEDEAALAELLADRNAAPLRLRRIAPTVLISPLSRERLTEELRAAGYSAVPEDTAGAIVFTRPDSPRTPGRRRAVRPGADLPTLDDDNLAEAVRSLRSGDDLARKARQNSVSTVDLPGVTTAATLSTLQEAAKNRSRVRLSYVDAHGGAALRVVRPINVGAGYLRAEDDRTEVLHTFALHRITAALPAEKE